MTALHPYFPCLPGSAITYAVFDVEGQFDPHSGYFGIMKQDPHPNSPQRVTVIQRGALRGRCFHNPENIPTITPGSTLYQARWGADVTEAAGTRVAQSGGIPLLSDVMTPGAVLEGGLAVTHFDIDGEPMEFGAYHYKRFTHHVGQSWAGWPDTIRTCILENKPGQLQIPIAYVFARNIGIVDWWRGELQSDGVTVRDGTRYYAVSW